MAKDCHNIYRRLFELAEPFQLPAPADSLRLDEDIRSSVPSDDSLRRVLEEEFGADQLREAGVFDELVSGYPDFPLGLTDAGPLVALRKDSGTIFDVVTPLGCLSGEVTLLQMLRDARTRALADAGEGMIFAADSLADVAVLRGLGLAAVPMVGLECLDYSGLRKIAAAFGGGCVGHKGDQPVKLPPECFEPEPNGTSDNRKRRVIPRSLTLVTHSLVRPSLEIAAGFRTVASHLARFQRYMDADIWDLFVWWPTEDELLGLRYCIEIGALGEARLRVLDNEELKDLKIFIDPGRTPARRDAPAGLPAVLGRVREDRAKRRRSPSEERHYQASLDEYERVVDRDLIASLVEQALEIPCPVAQNQGIILAETFRIIHQQAPAIEDDLAEMRRRNDPERAQQAYRRMKEIRQTIASAQSLAKAYKKNRQEAARQRGRGERPGTADTSGGFADSLKKGWPR
jgi:hypothetical protein